MTKAEIRKAIMSIFTERPKGKYEAMAWVWNRALIITWGGILNWVAMLTANGYFLIWLYTFGLVVFCIVYFLMAKGK